MVTSDSGWFCVVMSGSGWLRRVFIGCSRVVVSGYRVLTGWLRLVTSG